MGTNGVVLRNDYLNPFYTQGYYGYSTGFLSSDGNWVTGLGINPNFMGLRLLRYCNNYTYWRPRKVSFCYQPVVGTTSTGNFIVTVTRDPTAFIEATTSQVTPLHTTAGLTQNVPLVTGSVYRPWRLDYSDFDPNAFYPTNNNTYIANNSIVFNDASSQAWLRGNFPIRLVGNYQGPSSNVYAQSGILWIFGEFEFYGPSSNAFSITGNVGGTGLKFAPKTCHDGINWRVSPSHVIDDKNEPAGPLPSMDDDKRRIPLLGPTEEDKSLSSAKMGTIPRALPADISHDESMSIPLKFTQAETTDLEVSPESIEKTEFFK
jgi:hypothetical protein